MKRTPIQRRTPLKRVSAKRQREGRIYSVQRRAFLAKFFLCQVDMRELGYDETIPPVRENGMIRVAHAVSRGWGSPVWCMVPEGHIQRSQDVHHTARRGRYYLDESTWLAVARKNHDRIEQNPGWARRVGWLIDPRR